jgi:Tfp pilus assembly ATPase PilU
MIEGDFTITTLLGAMRRFDASDLHIKVGLPPVMRVGGELKPIEGEPMSEQAADAPARPDRARRDARDV